MQLSTWRAVVRRPKPRRASSTKTRVSQHVHEIPQFIEPADVPGVEYTQLWPCPTCGRILGPDSPEQPWQYTCPDERCRARQKKTSLVARGQSQQPNTSARRVPVRIDAEEYTLNNGRSEPRLVTAAEEKLVEGLFWSCYLPMANQGGGSTVRSSEYQAPYEMLREITSGSPLVKRCAQAVAFANLGRENRDRRLNMRGAQIYHSVLLKARDMIASNIATTQQRDELLACCLVMCTYELLRDDTEPGSWYFDSYHHHVRGMCQVLRTIRMPGEPSISLKYAWREARFMSARAAMFIRMPVFGLERPPQWPSMTASLNLCDDMLDCMFDLARWYPLVDQLMHQPDQLQPASAQLAAVKNVVDRGLELARQLMAWEERATAHYCNDQQPSLYSLCSTADGELLNTLTHFWMTCMLLHSQLQMIKARFSLDYPDMKLPPWINPWPYAVFIVIAGPMFSHPRFGIWSALAAHTPMIATTFYFSATGNWHTPEARDLRNYVEEKHRPGNGLMRRFFHGLFAGVDILIPQAEMVKAAQTWYGIRDSTPWKGEGESKK